MWEVTPARLKGERVLFLLSFHCGRTLIIDREGGLIGRYCKAHVYPTENRYLRAGDAFPVVELEAIQVGTATYFAHGLIV